MTIIRVACNRTGHTIDSTKTRDLAAVRRTLELYEKLYDHGKYVTTVGEV